MTWGELAMLTVLRDSAIAAREDMIRRTGRVAHPYAGATAWCIQNGLIPADAVSVAPVTKLPETLFDPVKDFTAGRSLSLQKLILAGSEKDLSKGRRAKKYRRNAAITPIRQRNDN